MPAAFQGVTLLLLALTLLAAACGGAPPAGSATPSPPPASSFAPDEVLDAASLTRYDRAAPLDLRDEGDPRRLGTATVHDVSWASPRGGRISAWLVVPAGGGPHAAIVYQHGSETWRDDFLDEAVAMAHGGAISLVLDAPFARSGDDRRYALQSYDAPAEERDMTAQAIVDVRRAYDVLEARDDVDPQRLAYVGHSWGASLGVVVAAVDPRPASLVLITARPSWTGFLAESEEDWVRRQRDRVGQAAWQEYLSLLAPLDATAEIDNVDGQRLYFQYGTQDEVVPERVARRLVDAAAGAQSDFYPAGHALDDRATADRVAWLVERLQLSEIGPEVLVDVGLPDR